MSKKKFNPPSTPSKRSLEKFADLKDKFLERLRENKGIVNLTCVEFNLQKKYWYEWIVYDEEFGRDCDLLRKEFNENVMGFIYAAAEKGNIHAMDLYKRFTSHYVNLSQHKLNLSTVENCYAAKDILLQEVWNGRISISNCEKMQQLINDKINDIHNGNLMIKVEQLAEDVKLLKNESI